MFKINTVSGRWLIFTSFLAIKKIIIKKKYYSEQNKDNQGSFFIKYKKKLRIIEINSCGRNRSEYICSNDHQNYKIPQNSYIRFLTKHDFLLKKNLKMQFDSTLKWNTSIKNDQTKKKNEFLTLKVKSSTCKS